MSKAEATPSTDPLSLEEQILNHEYLEVYRAPLTHHIETVRNRLSAAVLKLMAEDMEISRERLYSNLYLARATVVRKTKNDAKMSAEESERTLALAELIGQVEEMVQRSGNPKGFDAAKWVAHWLEQPSPALGGTAPVEWMDTARGRQLVSNTIARMQSGAYA